MGWLLNIKIAFITIVMEKQVKKEEKKTNVNNAIIYNNPITAVKVRIYDTTSSGMLFRLRRRRSTIERQYVISNKRVKESRAAS